jgi:hypothetical protein
METVEKKALQGGEWLVRETEAQDIFTPEEWTEEQQMIAQTCRDFIAQEVTPKRVSWVYWPSQFLRNSVEWEPASTRAVW